MIFEDSLLRNKVAPLIRSDPSTARLPDSGKLLATWLAAAWIPAVETPKALAPKMNNASVK